MHRRIVNHPDTKVAFSRRHELKSTQRVRKRCGDVLVEAEYRLLDDGLVYVAYQ